MAHRVLVGVDGSEGSRRALAWAVQDAAAQGAVVEAVTVCRGGGDDMAGKYFPYVTSHQMNRPSRLMVDEARRRLSGAASELAARHPNVQIEARVVQGEDPAETLCRRAQDADLLVVGSRGRGSFAALLLGSVASKCAHHAPGPIVIVPRHEPDEERQAPTTRGCMVVGVDMSEGARHALEWAIDEATARDWTVQAVTVWTRTYDYEAEHYWHEEHWPADDKNEEAARLSLERTIDEFAAAEPAVTIESRVVEGDPAQRLCELSANAKLLIVGRRGRGGFSGLQLGSVATKCARHSACPVAIVRHQVNRVELASTPLPET